MQNQRQFFFIYMSLITIFCCKIILINYSLPTESLFSFLMFKLCYFVKKLIIVIVIESGIQSPKSKNVNLQRTVNIYTI